MPEHYTVVEGFALPAPLGGNPALDFCNTRVGWAGEGNCEGDYDYLERYEHLAVWAGHAGLLSDAAVQALRSHARDHPRAAAAALGRARLTRTALYRGLTAPTQPAAFKRLAGEVEAATTAIQLAHVDGQVAWRIDPAAALDGPRLAAAWAAAQLLASPAGDRIRTCPGPGCGWLFLDRSGRRRWCTMATCGNRAKVRRFAERRRRPGGS